VERSPAAVPPAAPNAGTPSAQPARCRRYKPGWIVLNFLNHSHNPISWERAYYSRAPIKFRRNMIMKMLRSLLLSALMSLPMSRLRSGETGI
jgi:hypothetical protein